MTNSGLSGSRVEVHLGAGGPVTSAQAICRQRRHGLSHACPLAGAASQPDARQEATVNIQQLSTILADVIEEALESLDTTAMRRLYTGCCHPQPKSAQPTRT